jgi:hypothetical protein
LSGADDDHCLIMDMILVGVVVPVHSDAERETFYILEGEVGGLW